DGARRPPDGRPSLHGVGRQRRRVGAPGRVRARPIARCPARPVRPGRPGLGPARLPLGGDGAERPRLAPRARGAGRGALRRRPPGFPPLSVATSGTHDTSALATWWEEELGADGRRALAAVPSLGRLGGAGAAFTPAVHEALLDGLYGAGSALVVLPFPDAYG